jgi:deazaflavin-dependent oxidoreductase (nitroreductase family)
MENDISEAERERRAYAADHLDRYLRSGGADGHIVDGQDSGGHRFTATLLLRYPGRKSGRTITTPLVYGSIGGEVVIAASRGPDVPPAWYLNVVASKEVSFQIGGQAFRASWREPGSAESEAVWRFMESVFPPYRKIRAAANRDIPLVMLQPIEEIERFKPGAT